MKLRYTIILHPLDEDEGPGYWVEVPALPGCVTWGTSFEHALAMAQEAIEGLIASMAAHGEPIPQEPQPEGEVRLSVAVDSPIAA